MQADLANYLFHLEQYSSSETRNTVRYRWDNLRWPNGHFVIIQHTLSGQGIYARQGRGHEVVGAGRAFIAVVPERSTYFFPPGAEAPWQFRWLNMRGPLACGFWKAFCVEFGEVPLLEAGSPAERQLNDLFRFLDEGTPADPLTVSERIYSFALAWQRQLRKVAVKPVDALPEAAAFCERHYRLPIKVKEIAAHVGLSREHLTRIFQERYQVSPAMYLRQLRLKAARELLDSTGHPLSEVAVRAGFQDARQLRKWLREDEG